MNDRKHRSRVTDLEAKLAASEEKARRFYSADGSFITLDTEAEVIARRIDAARRLAELEVALAAETAARQLAEAGWRGCEIAMHEALGSHREDAERHVDRMFAAHPPRDPDELVSKRDGWWWVNGDDKTRHGTKAEAVRAANVGAGR